MSGRSIKPKYGVNPTFSRFVGRRGGLQLGSRREGALGGASTTALAHVSMTDPERRDQARDF
jgi:hypothetical protein